MHPHLPIMLADAPQDFAWWTWTYTIVSVIALLLALASVPSVLMQRQGKPQAAMSWVLVLVLLPFVGLFLWWAIGRKHLYRKRRKRRLTTRQRTDRLADLQDDLPAPPEASWDLLPVRRLPAPEAEWVFPPTNDNHVRVLVDSDQAYPAMEQAIQSSRQFVHALFYIWQDDDTGRKFRDLLVERAKSGVEVRVLVDAIGGSAVRGEFMRPLEEAGASVAAFAPPAFFRRSLELNFRNHRKLLVADGHQAVMGGLNIGDEYTHQWRDTALRLEGPAVDQLEEIFADDWYFATGEDYVDRDYFGQWHDELAEPQGHPAACGVVASGPHTEINLTHQAFFIAINGAQHRIWIATPYFVPDQAILTSLGTAVFRGVDVRIIVPEKSDSRIATLAGKSYYGELLRAGVRIFEHQGDFLHAKTAIIDEGLSVVGSANMDIRSFRLNFELSCFVRSTPVCDELSALFSEYLASSREMFVEQIEAKPYLVRLTESAAHLLSPLL